MFVGSQQAFSKVTRATLLYEPQITTFTLDSVSPMSPRAALISEVPFPSDSSLAVPVVPHGTLGSMCMYRSHLDNQIYLRRCLCVWNS